MRILTLQEILAHIGVEDFRGTENPIIKHVMDYSAKDIDDHTLVFHMDHERIRGKYWGENSSIVIITDQPELCTDLGDHILLIKTADLEGAYWRFIEYYRGLFTIPVIGITGTCGKTTTKEMIRQILLEDYRVKATWMSMNSMSVNLRYLTGIDDQTEVAVFEMPVAYPGYLRTACRCFQPQIRLLLNIGVHHLADCETPEEYWKAKGEIVEGLDPVQGKLILNADDETIKKVIDERRFQGVVYFGRGEQAHFRARNAQYADGGMSFTLEHGEEAYEAFVPGFGVHNIYNALAAIAAVSFVGVDVPTSIQRLAAFEPIEEHLEMKRGTNGCNVIDDSWNSSPLSMSAALQVLKEVGKGKKSIALLGYMPQLGDGIYAVEQYREMGKKAAETGVDLLVVVGEEAEEIGREALKQGLAPEQVHFCQTGDEVFEVLDPYLNQSTVILLKITHRVMKKPTFQKLRKKLMIDGEDE